MACTSGCIARWLIRDGDWKGGGGGGRKSEGSTADSAQKRPERPGRGPPPEQWKC